MEALKLKEFVLGCDEVGYGCIAGPLVVAGVRAPNDWDLVGLNDSKKLTPRKREVMRDKLLQLVKDNVITWHLAERSNLVIDKFGLAPTLKDAYVEIFHKLCQKDTLIISDGILKFDNLGVDAYDKVSVIKADNKFPTVMAASILAKTYRDELMGQHHNTYPQYGWDSNVGYGASAHIAAIKKHGYTPLHRRSYEIKALKDFVLPSDQLELKFD